MKPFKVSKITVDPSRTIGLANFSSVKLSAGLEIVFDNPVDIDSQELKDAFSEARKVVHEEFVEQFKPYKK